MGQIIDKNFLKYDFLQNFYEVNVFKKSAPDAIREYEESLKKNPTKYLLRSRPKAEVTSIFCRSIVCYLLLFTSNMLFIAMIMCYLFSSFLYPFLSIFVFY